MATKKEKRLFLWFGVGTAMLAVSLFGVLKNKKTVQEAGGIFIDPNTGVVVPGCGGDCIVNSDCPFDKECFIEGCCDKDPCTRNCGNNADCNGHLCKNGICTDRRLGDEFVELCPDGITLRRVTPIYEATCLADSTWTNFVEVQRIEEGCP